MREELTGCVDWASLWTLRNERFLRIPHFLMNHHTVFEKLTEFAGSLDLGITSLSWAGLFPWKQSFILFILGVEYHLGVHNCVL